MVSHLPILIFGSVFAFIVSLVALRCGFYKALPKIPYPTVPNLGDVLFIFFSFFLFYQFIFPFLLYGFFSWKASSWSFGDLQNLSKETQTVANCIAIYSSLLFLWGSCRLLRPTILWKVKGSEKTKSWKERISNLAFGATTFFVCFPIVFLVSQLLAVVIDGWFPHIEEDQVAVKVLKTALLYPHILPFYLIAVVLVAPCVEEFIFRGVLQRWISEKLGPWRGIFLSSIVFAAMHYSLSQGIYNFQLLPALFLLSCYLGYLYERQRTLWASFGLHASFNLFSALMLLLTQLK